jgi:hypothetical protein
MTAIISISKVEIIDAMEMKSMRPVRSFPVRRRNLAPVVYVNAAAAAKARCRDMYARWQDLRERKWAAGGYGGDRDDDYCVALTKEMILLEARMITLFKRHSKDW